MDTTANSTDSAIPEPGTATPEPGTAPPYTAAPTSAVVTTAPPAREHRRFTLRRSRTDVWLGGVCGGLAEELDVDPALIRVATIAVTLFTGGGLALVYLAAWILAPREGAAAV